MTKTLQNIELKNLTRDRKAKPIYIRPTRKICKWMAENDISPSKIFNEAVGIIMEQSKK